MRFRLNQTSDVIFFPFFNSEMKGIELEVEFMLYDRYFHVWDIKRMQARAPKHDWGKDGQLFVYGHGYDTPEDRNYIYAKRNSDSRRLADQVATYVAEMKFPVDDDHPIVVWSCHSGRPGGFAQMLTLHLIKKGYFGKRIYGCNKFGG